MSSLLDKQICVRLNRSWQAYSLQTVKETVVFLCSEKDGEKPGFAIDFETAIDENGERTLVYANPVPWEQWIQMPIRDGDLAIETSRGPIRVPLVTICRSYNKVPMRKKRLSSGNVFERDGGVCQYTGEKVGRSGGNLDHVTPRDRGGRDTWDNLVWCKREINSRKGNQLNHEAGLSLIRQPKAPAAMPALIRKKDAPFPDQHPFLLD